jgi:hypothetical protein
VAAPEVGGGRREGSGVRRQLVPSRIVGPPGSGPFPQGRRVEVDQSQDDHCSWTAFRVSQGQTACRFCLDSCPGFGWYYDGLVALGEGQGKAV